MALYFTRAVDGRFEDVSAVSIQNRLLSYAYDVVHNACFAGDTRAYGSVRRERHK